MRELTTEERKKEKRVKGVLQKKKPTGCSRKKVGAQEVCYGKNLARGSASRGSVRYEEQATLCLRGSPVREKGISREEGGGLAAAGLALCRRGGLAGVKREKKRGWRQGLRRRRYHSSEP